MQMDAVATKRKRTCRRTRTVATVQTQRASQICVPMDRELYDRIWRDVAGLRKFLEGLIAVSPELFPAGIEEGFVLSGTLPESKKLPGIRLRQLRLKTGERRAFSLRPSFVTSDMTGTVEALDKPLFLLSFGVPMWAVVYCYGRDEMYWHRHVERFGRNRVVGTTVRVAERLPEHLAADEHHVKWLGQKGYLATTTGGGCLLGVALTNAADDASCHAAYGDFCRAARDLSPEYSPRTVSTDGWKPTQNAFTALFQTVIILCFLHGFLKVRDRKDHELHQQIWHANLARLPRRVGRRLPGTDDGTTHLVRLPTAEARRTRGREETLQPHRRLRRRLRPPRLPPHEQRGRTPDEPKVPPGLRGSRLARPSTDIAATAPRLGVAAQLPPRSPPAAARTERTSARPTD